MQLSVLESRLLHELPEKHHETVEREFAKFEMETTRLGETDEKFGQATLTDRELERAKTTNQYGSHGHTTIELQSLKAVALKHGIDDWLSYVDPELSYGENMDILKNHGSNERKVQ
jgi:hypothetical protein